MKVLTSVPSNRSLQLLVTGNQSVHPPSPIFLVQSRTSPTYCRGEKHQDLYFTAVDIERAAGITYVLLAFRGSSGVSIDRDGEGNADDEELSRQHHGVG